jgi:hypothetical protein
LNRKIVLYVYYHCDLGVGGLKHIPKLGVHFLIC